MPRETRGISFASFDPASVQPKRVVKKVDTSAFWKVYTPGDVEPVKKFALKDNLHIVITNNYDYSLVVVPEVDQDIGRTVYGFYKNGISESERIATYHQGENIVNLGGSYQQAQDPNGNPTSVPSDLVRCLMELRGFIESTPGLVKKARYQEIIKPMTDGLIKCFKLV